ncbi:MAG TPA: cupin domain-containing protein [Xanthobacteraceae bacterium]|jgi:quercetin dioxygenase-like cupin family protein|nr:cupin domain-containing protein [Xanthobacteraceae bacterium]
MLTNKLLLAIVITPVLVVSSTMAQQANIKRTVLRSIDYPPGYTTVTAIAEIAPGTCAGRHTHPGIDSGYVMEGDLLLKVDGKLDQTLKAGASFETPPYTPHDACTTSGVKALDTYVVERGKPLASPAP